MNRGEPPDDLSKIRGRSSVVGDPITLPRNLTDKSTECSYGKLDFSFLSTQGGADTPVPMTGDGYKNGGEVKSTRRHSGKDVDPSDSYNHSGPGRGGDTSLSCMSH
ncbi:hypothetical protein MKX01_003092 [Papaver californicum]|nr:hypothetical protein MKX01_003092 [Papaver californicum]